LCGSSWSFSSASSLSSSAGSGSCGRLRLLIEGEGVGPCGQPHAAEQVHAQVDGAVTDHHHAVAGEPDHGVGPFADGPDQLGAGDGLAVPLGPGLADREDRSGVGFVHQLLGVAAGGDHRHAVVEGQAVGVAGDEALAPVGADHHERELGSVTRHRSIPLSNTTPEWSYLDLD
jgi:hypothetical protein